MTEQNTTIRHWSEADFGEMSWHDCLIHGVWLDQDGEYQSDLVLDLDYIVEWIKTEARSFWFSGAPPRSLRFRVAPAVLRFQNVDKLQIQMLLSLKEAIRIYWVDRVANEDKGFKEYHWTIKIQAYSEEIGNRIEFDATGFVQELTAAPVVIEEQSLTRQEREEMKNRNCEQENHSDEE